MAEPGKTLRDGDDGPFEERARPARRIDDRPEIDGAIRRVARVLEDEIYKVLRRVDLPVRASLIDGQAFEVLRRKLQHRTSDPTHLCVVPEHKSSFLSTSFQ